MYVLFHCMGRLVSTGRRSTEVVFETLMYRTYYTVLFVKNEHGPSTIVLNSYITLLLLSSSSIALILCVSDDSAHSGYVMLLHLAWVLSYKCGYITKVILFRSQYFFFSLSPCYFCKNPNSPIPGINDSRSSR